MTRTDLRPRASAALDSPCPTRFATTQGVHLHPSPLSNRGRASAQPLPRVKSATRGAVRGACAPMWYRFIKMKVPFAFLSGLLGLCCSVVACSAGQSDSGSRASAGPGSTTPTGGTLPNIDTSSGDPSGMNGTPEGCGSILAVKYRDFSEAHPDFEGPFSGDVVRRRLVQAMLGDDHKPVFADSIGRPALKDTPLDVDNWMVTQPVIQSAATFAQWYNTTAGINQEFEKTLQLVESPAGSGIWGYSSNAFFPLGPDEGFGVAPKNHDMHMNFLFTTEVHVLFTYSAAQKFTFSGDDDLWIFVNGKLALDLGSMHGPADGTIDFDAQAAALGISVGNTYPMDVFHAERHTRGSNFKITTNIACFTPGVLK